MSVPTRQITIQLQSGKGWRRRQGGHIRLEGAEITFVQPGVLREPMTLPAGLIELAAVEHGAAPKNDHGRFVVVRRLAGNIIVPKEEGIEGWLWSSRNGSVLPGLQDSSAGVPNLALLFTVPLATEQMKRHFDAKWLHELAERSPHGNPVIPGLLAVVTDVLAAETAFKQFGVLKPITDREVSPVMRRHLPGDKPANPKVVPAAEDPRIRTSFAPPGMA